MQRKLTLNLEDLSVDSFDTTRPQKVKGTVFGEQCTCYTQCTCPGCPTCDNTCAYTCDDNTCPACPTCANSCNGTCAGASCGASCYGTCEYVSCNYADCRGNTDPLYSGCTPYACL